MCISWLLASVPQIDLSYNYLTGRNGDEMDGIKAIAEAICVPPSVTCLDVRFNAISGDGASQLSAAVLGNPKMETFNEIPIKEMRTDSLTKLDLRGKGIGVVGGMVVAGLLPVMPSLTSIDLSRNNLRDEGAKALAPALRDSPSLTEVLAFRESAPATHPRLTACCIVCRSTSMVLPSQSRSLRAPFLSVRSISLGSVSVLYRLL
jgi:hypothetical protein